MAANATPRRFRGQPVRSTPHAVLCQRGRERPVVERVIPKAVTKSAGDPRYCEIRAEDGQIVLTPVRIQRADAVRAKLAELDLNEHDIADAVAWARRPAK